MKHLSIGLSKFFVLFKPIFTLSGLISEQKRVPFPFIISSKYNDFVPGAAQTSKTIEFSLGLSNSTIAPEALSWIFITPDLNYCLSAR